MLNRRIQFSITVHNVDEVIKMKEFKEGKNNKWVELLRKKWFLPALYITIAGIILSAVVWYQAIGNPWMKSSEMKDEFEQQDNSFATDFDEEAQSVLQQQETIQMPIDESVDAEIVTKFYDYEADEKEQEQGLTLYNNRYYQSTGIDIAETAGESFDVVASLSGTVTEVKEDPLLGNIVTLAHGDSITTHYASLEEVNVEAGKEIKQGDKIGRAGKNIFNEEGGVHVHFEIHKDGIEVNPEQFFNEQVSKLEDYEVEVVELEDEATEEDLSEDENEEEDSKQDDKEESKTPNNEVSFSITT